MQGKFFNVIALLSVLLLFPLSACTQETSREPAQETISQYAAGETIHFEIKKLMMKLGSASLVYNGLTTIDGQEAILVTFTAEGLNFYDQEKIYMDPEEMYPLLVERDLNIWGKKEKIDEVYDQQKGRVTVVKYVNDKTEETVIDKGKKLDNIYCFLYRYRRSGSFEIGDTLDLVLPTKDVSIALKEKQEVEAGGETHNAYYLESEPKQYSLWFGAGKKKIPLRIDGAVGIGNTKMVMTEYFPESP